jgi:phosphoribosylglycinamide formyltransferase 1
MKKRRIAIFASGSGSNAEEIIRYFSGHPRIEVALLLSNNANAFAIERAKSYSIPVMVFSREEFLNSDSVINRLHADDISHIVLAGFLWLVPASLIRAFPDRIINIHPALLPSFGGKGMYGMKVHEAVKASGNGETGITIHLVNEYYDEGRVIFQGKCRIDPSLSPMEIAACVHALEHENYPRVIEEWISSET